MSQYAALQGLQILSAQQRMVIFGGPSISWCMYTPKFHNVGFIPWRSYLLQICATNEKGEGSLRRASTFILGQG